MKKYKSKYLKPYIRKLKKGDRKKALNSDIRTSLRISMATDTDCGGYVLVQHGSSRILEFATDKWQLKRCIYPVYISKKHKSKAYNQWCNDIKHYCQKGEKLPC